MPLLAKDQFIDLAMFISISHYSNKVGEKFEDKNGFGKIKLNLDEGRDVEDKNLKSLLTDNYDNKRYDIKEFKRALFCVL